MKSNRMMLHDDAHDDTWWCMVVHELSWWGMHHYDESTSWKLMVMHAWSVVVIYELSWSGMHHHESIPSWQLMVMHGLPWWCMNYHGPPWKVDKLESCKYRVRLDLIVVFGGAHEPPTILLSGEVPILFLFFCVVWRGDTPWWAWTRPWTVMKFFVDNEVFYKVNTLGAHGSSWWCMVMPLWER